MIADCLLASDAHAYIECQAAIGIHVENFYNESNQGDERSNHGKDSGKQGKA